MSFGIYIGNNMTHADDLQRIIDSSASEISAHFFDWVAQTLDGTDWELFERSVESGNFNQAANLVKWADYDPTAPISKAYQEAAIENTSYIQDITGLKNSYDLKDPNALNWIHTRGADLVQDIGEGARRDLREVIYRGYFSGYTPRQQTEYIRGLVGLDERRLRAVDNYAAALQKKGLSSDAINAKTQKYSDKLLKQRARTIAVNEASEAANRGQYFSTKDAYNRGILGPEWEEYRIVAWDERLCDRCAPLAGEARGLPDGVYPSSGDVIPKLHVMCRCCAGYRKIGTDQGTKNPNQEAAMTEGQIEEAVQSSIDVVFEGRLKETDESIYIPTVPIVEGVFHGRGFPALRTYDEFSKNARWLNGLPVVMNHEELSPSARRVGQLGGISPDDGRKRIKATTEFFKRDLTPNELESLRTKGPKHGSLSFQSNLEHTPGTWNGTPYDAVEKGPYIFKEYSLVSEGVVTPEDGAGFNIEASAQFTDKPWDGSASRYKDTDDYCSACLIDYNEPGEPKTQAKCKLPVKDPDGTYNKNAIRNARARISQLKGVPSDKVAAAKKRLDYLANQAKIGTESKSKSPAHRAVKFGGYKRMGDTDDPGYEPGIQEAVKPLITEAVEAAKAELTAKYEAKILALEAEARAREIIEFKRDLKPGFQDKAAELFEALQANPIKWVRENRDKLVVSGEEHQLQGAAVTEGTKETDPNKLLHEGMAKIYGYAKGA